MAHRLITRKHIHTQCPISFPKKAGRAMSVLIKEGVHLEFLAGLIALREGLIERILLTDESKEAKFIEVKFDPHLDGPLGRIEGHSVAVFSDNEIGSLIDFILRWFAQGSFPVNHFDLQLEWTGHPHTEYFTIEFEMTAGPSAP